MKNNLKEIVVSLVLILLSVLLLNPFDFWMPDAMVMSMLFLTFVSFLFLSIFVLREKAEDEREEINKMISGRFAFITGSALLTLGVIVQSLDHNVDKWLVISLVGMVLSKVIVRVYGDSRW